MKTTYKVLCTGFVGCMMALAFTSCDDFIDVEPKGVISEDLAMSQPDEMVTSAYAKLGSTGTLILSTCGPTATCRLTTP